jgi:hypothetical protein
MEISDDEELKHEEVKLVVKKERVKEKLNSKKYENLLELVEQKKRNQKRRRKDGDLR